MKKGSADDPFAEDPKDEDDEPDSEDELPAESIGGDESSLTVNSDTPATSEQGESQSTSQQRSLPYIYARDSVKDGRQQRPIFLRDEVEAGIPELVDQLETEFGEQVYRTDVLEAAVVVAQNNPELVEQTLEEWGYGW